MNNKFIKALSLIAVAVLGITLSACGKKAEEDTQDKYMYSSSFETVDFGIVNGYTAASYVIGDKVYSLAGVYDPNTYRSLDSLVCKYDIKTGEKETVSLERKPGDFYVNRMIVKDDESIVTLSQNYDEEAGESTYLIITYNKEGRIESEVNLSEISKLNNDGYLYLADFFIDRDGDFFFQMDQGVVVTDKEGKIKANITVNSYIYNAAQDNAGNIYVSFYDESEMGEVVKRVDKDKKAFTDKIDGLSLSGSIKGGKEGEFLVFNENGVYSFDVASKETTMLFSWIDVDIEQYDSSSFVACDDGTYRMLQTTWKDNGNQITELVTFKKGLVSNVEKKIIKLGAMYLRWDLKERIIEFNKTNPEYRISVETYDDRSDDYEANLNQFKTDIASGKFDIINADTSVMDTLVKKGALEDINPYIDRDLNRADYFDNVFRAFEHDGKLYTLVSDISVTTILAPKSVVSKLNGWNIDEAIKLREANKDKAFLSYSTKEGALYTFVNYSLGKYIDFESGKCNFENDEFYKILELCNTFPDEIDYDNYNEWEEIKKGNILLLSSSLSQVQELDIYEQLFGEPLCVLGYPTEDGGVSSFYNYNSLSISSKSKVKDGAWEFLKTMLDEDYQTSYYVSGLPVLKSAFDEKMADEMKVETYIDEDGVEHKASKGGWGMGDMMIEYYGASQETVDLIKECISTTTTSVRSDEKVSEIISEEVKAFFEGQKTAKDVATIIQSRVSIYLAENK